MIPKIIHYCWFGPKPLTDLNKKCIETWEQWLPDYEIKLWNEDNSPMHIPYVKQAYENKMWAFVSDYVRLHALHENGGIYLDTDIEIIKPLDKLVEKYNGFVSYERKDVLAAAVFASLPGNPFLVQMKEKTIKYFEKRKQYTNIPVILTDCLKTHKETLSEYDEICGITLLPADYFYPYNPYDKDKPIKQLMFSDITENTYGIHHWEKTWTYKKKINFLKLLRKKLNV